MCTCQDSYDSGWASTLPRYKELLPRRCDDDHPCAFLTPVITFRYPEFGKALFEGVRDPEVVVWACRAGSSCEPLRALIENSPLPSQLATVLEHRSWSDDPQDSHGRIVCLDATGETDHRGKDRPNEFVCGFYP